MDNYSIAKLYYNLNPEAYIYSYNNGWYEYNDNNILINRGNKIPVKLYNDFSDTLQKYTHEQLILLNINDEKYKEKLKICSKLHERVGDSTFIEKTIKQLTNLYLDDNLEKKLNNKNLLSFNNILYDYTLNEYRLIKKTDFITLTCGYDIKYKTIADKIIPNINISHENNIKKIINSIFEDDEINNFWMVSTALSLFGNKHEKFYIHSGKGGNGKGLLQRLLLNCLGQYYKQVSNNFLMGSISKGGADTEMSQCVGIRYLSISEPDDSDNKKFNISNLKLYSGGDVISTRGLYKDTFQFIPQFTIHLACNDIPKMSAYDGGVKRRTNIIVYPLEFKDSHLITNNIVHRPINYELKDIINNSEFIQTVITMFIKTAFEYKNIELKPPQKILNNNEEYAKDNNELNGWLEENIEKTNDEKDMIKSSELLLMYNNSNYCIKKLRPVDFSKLMETTGINKIRKTNVAYYVNIKYVILE